MRRLITLALFCFGAPILSVAQEPVDLAMVSKIKSEGFENSQVMETLFYLTDVHGPRLTNSPGYIAASNWCVQRLNEWGVEDARLESWGTFGKGWELEEYSIEMLEPQYGNLIAFPKAWTSGTNGVVSGKPMLVDIQGEADFDKYRGKLNGAIVMRRPNRDAETHFEADATRHDAESLLSMEKAPEPGARPSRFGDRADFRRRRALRNRMMKFFQEEGVAVVLEASRGEHGTLFVSRGGSHRMNAEPALPSLVVSAEQYWRMVRLLEKDIEVELKIQVQARYVEDDSLGYNVVAEIPGSDRKLKNELVMLGAHLDSWHSATGATDNASGSAVAMEAVRILTALNVQPRRTIRIALWGGEEQGLLGSRGYVQKHLADRETMMVKPDHEQFAGYFNLDNGTGKIRGVYMQGNDAVRPIFEAYLAPFNDLGATALAIRNTGGTDHLSFDRVGLPGFQFIQDPIDYSTRTHHTNMDVYDHALQSDLMQASVIMASFVYHTAMRDAKLPRKTMPEPQRPRATN